MLWSHNNKTNIFVILLKVGAGRASQGGSGRVGANTHYRPVPTPPPLRGG